MEMEFYRCKHCGQIVAVVKKTGVPVICCGEKMEKIVPSSTDAAVEKHVPVVKTEGNLVTVTVGEIAHPMIEEHYITWIEVISGSVSMRRRLRPGEPPEAFFEIPFSENLVAREYCNKHGLWKKK